MNCQYIISYARKLSKTSGKKPEARTYEINPNFLKAYICIIVWAMASFYYKGFYQQGYMLVSIKDKAIPFMHTGIVKPKIVVICGPTALGKTAVAIDIAKLFSGEIIGADSMQVYRHMDIGTAKPTPDEQARVPHHMIDIIDPDESFDAKQFAQMAHKKILDLHHTGVMPFVVGGTGLYIKAIVHGLFEAGTTDLEVRTRLKKEVKVHGSHILHNRLKGLDPDSAVRIHPNDAYRIIRALEIYELTGMAISDLHRTHRFKDEPFKVLKIGLCMDRELLYNRIDQRVDNMLEVGLVDEVKRLLGMGYSADLKSMQSIGYRHMIDFIEGRISWEKTLSTLKQDTRRYAKRQMTWFKADSEIVWSKKDQANNIRQTIKKFLQDK